MTNLSREQVKRILQDKPQGLSDAEVIGGLLEKGHTLQGFGKEKEQTTFDDVAKAVIGFGKGAVKATAEELQNVGQIIAQPIGTKVLGLEPEDIGFSREQLQREGHAEKAGGVAAQTASFFVPGSAAAKLGKAFQATRGGVRGLAGRAALEGTTAAGVAAAQEGAFNRESAFVGGVGASFPVLGGVAKTMGFGAGRFFFGAKGITGIKARFLKPELTQSFLKTARRQEGGDTLQKFVERVNGSVDDVRKKARDAFVVAEEKLVSAKVDVTQAREGSKSLIKEFLDEETLTKEAIETSGVTDQSANVITKIVKLLDGFDDDTTKGLLKLRRKIDKLYKGTKNTGESDAVVTRLRNFLNEMLEEQDPAFREASRSFAKDRKFLDLLRVNVMGKSKENLDQTANKLFRIAKDLDDPFRNEGAEQLLRELEERTGLPIVDVLRAISTADNLSPQQAQGLRAGIVRELTRIMEIAVSGVAGTAGALQNNPTTRSAVQNIRDLTRSAIFTGVRGVTDEGRAVPQ